MSLPLKSNDSATIPPAQCADTPHAARTSGPSANLTRTSPAQEAIEYDIMERARNIIAQRCHKYKTLYAIKMSVRVYGEEELKALNEEIQRWRKREPPLPKGRRLTLADIYEGWWKIRPKQKKTANAASAVQDTDPEDEEETELSPEEARSNTVNDVSPADDTFEGPSSSAAVELPTSRLSRSTGCGVLDGGGTTPGFHGW
ncbi:hypothetical protein OH77DRAFT_1440591 [Trametes cingulata]|nr:hypothetical protein OH77DRAFT_1440591 [Trametes cingulata]